MRPFSKIKANGEPRYRQEASHHQAKREARSRATNRGVLYLRGVHPHSEKARRFRDLARSYGEGLSLDDEEVKALVREAATAAIMIEEMHAATMRDEPIDKLEFGRLTGVRRRSVEKLAELRKEASPTPAAEVEGQAALTRLRRHLAQLARQG
jgi:hypothetical protein